MAEAIRPMLAENAAEADVRFPCLGSLKIDGVRALAIDGEARSRSGKLHKNRHLQGLFRAHARELQGLDVEVIVGPPNAEDVCRVSSSGVNTVEGQPDFRLHAFDMWNMPSRPYRERWVILLDSHLFDLPPFVEIVPQKLLCSLDELLAYEHEALSRGYEGLILRDAQAPYKYGRSTLKQGYLLKFKRFLDFEAVVIGVKEKLHNTNEARLDELGYTRRSSHQENMVPAGTLGVLEMRAINGPFEGVEFDCGTFKGFTAPELKALWDNHVSGQTPLTGRIGKVSCFNVGIKDKPRFPKLLAWRDPNDMGE
jgi:DNA ligase-1